MNLQSSYEIQRKLRGGSHLIKSFFFFIFNMHMEQQN
jgi:hypothetical protein